MTYAALVRQLCLHMVVVHVQDQCCAISVSLAADETGQSASLVSLVHMVLQSQVRQEVLEYKNEISYG